MKDNTKYPVWVSSQWIKDCTHFHGKVLVGDGAHYCYDWDELPIDVTCKEYECCTCEFPDDEENV